MIKNKIQLDLSTSGSGYINLNKQIFDIKHQCIDFANQSTLDTLFADPIGNAPFMYDGVKYAITETPLLSINELTVINPVTLETKTAVVENGAVVEFFDSSKRGYGTNGWIVYNLNEGDYIQVSTAYYRYIRGTNISDNIWSWDDEYSSYDTTQIDANLYNIIQDNLNEDVIYLTTNSTYQNQHKKHGIMVDCTELYDFGATYNGNTPEVIWALTSSLFSYGCLVKGTQITMANGTKKSIEDIEIDDVLMSYNNTVVSVYKKYNIEAPTIEINKGLLKTSLSHIHCVIVDNEVKTKLASELIKGDILKDINGMEIPITNLKLTGIETVYNITVDDFDNSHMYYANDILTHNKP